MAKLAKHRVPFTILIVVCLLLVATAAIFYARGFKPDFKNGSFQRTGLIVVSSIPTGANVYLDDRLTSATDTNIAFLEPRKYKVRIEKEGFTTWEKEIEIKADLAYEIKALLFPTAPETKPETTTGAASPTLSPDSSKIAYGVAGLTNGLYVLPMSDRPFPFRQTARLVAKNQNNFDFSKATFTWAPDSKQLIAHFKTETGQPTANLLIDTDQQDQQLRDITGSQQATLRTWQGQIDARSATLSVTVPESVRNATGEAELATSPKSTTSPAPQVTQSQTALNYSPTGLTFSPDEEKVLYKNKEGKYKVYDLKEKVEYSLPDFDNFINISWYPDSNHLVVAQKDLISIIEADGTNKMGVYSGKFENGFVFAHPSGTRVIILSTLFQNEGNPPNLYSINLR